MPSKSKKTIGLGILSWQAHETLVKSLESYPKSFLKAFDKKVIYFSDITEQDKAIAKKYGWDCAGGPNEGIAAGMKHLAESLDTDYVLLLQNDNPLCEDVDFAIDHIQKAVNLLDNGKADLARMRHRWKVGEGFADVTKYLRYYPAHEIDKQFLPEEHDGKKLDFTENASKMLRRIMKSKNAKRFKGRSVFLEKYPHVLYPSEIHKQGEFFILDSSVIDFTDQCLLISRDKWLDVFVPYVEAHPSSTRSTNGFQAPEICINGPWWCNNHFKILQGQGVFTHARFDGSFRENHHSNKKTSKNV